MGLYVWQGFHVLVVAGRAGPHHFSWLPDATVAYRKMSFEVFSSLILIPDCNCGSNGEKKSCILMRNFFRNFRNIRYNAKQITIVKTLNNGRLQLICLICNVCIFHFNANKIILMCK